MNQDSSFPPMLPPSTEFSALLFAVLPCLQEPYRPFVSFAYHMTELTKLKNIPSVPNLSGLSGIDALITDKDNMLRSLSFYGKLFRMPLLSTIANLLQALQFYQTYKDMIPGLMSAFGGGTEDSSSPFGSMAGLFSGLGGLSGFGGLSPDILSSLFGGSSDCCDTNPPPVSEPQQSSSDTLSAPNAASEANSNDIRTEPTHAADDSSSTESIASDVPLSGAESDNELFDSLYSLLTPEQKEIYDKLMHTD